MLPPKPSALALPAVAAILDRYFGGEIAALDAVPVELNGTPFQKNVWQALRRIRGVRANASRRSHAELDEAPELDPGDPHELAGQYRELADRLPWLNVFGGCGGADLRHVTEIARAVRSRESSGRISP